MPVATALGSKTCRRSRTSPVRVVSHSPTPQRICHFLWCRLFVLSLLFLMIDRHSNRTAPLKKLKKNKWYTINSATLLRGGTDTCSLFIMLPPKRVDKTLVTFLLNVPFNSQTKKKTSRGWGPKREKMSKTTKMAKIRRKILVVVTTKRRYKNKTWLTRDG